MQKRNVRKKDRGYYVFKVIRYPAKWYIHHILNLNMVKNEARNDKDPFLIIGNHVTAYDPIITLIYMKQFIRFVAADANLDSKLKRFLFNLGRVIPISKRNSDVKTIRRLMEEVKGGNSVGLFPEGGRNWSGETEELIRSTSKLIKLLGIKVYVQKLKGAYVSSPRWGKTLRKGRLDITVTKMLDQNEIKDLSDEEIYALMVKELYHNDYLYQKEEMVRLKGKDHAEYIERLIYVCPKCEAVNSFTSHKDEFHCKECLAKGTVDTYGFIKGDFPYDNLVDWYHYEKNYLSEHPLKPFQIYDVPYKSSLTNKKEKQLINLYFEEEQFIIEKNEERIEINYKSITEPSITFKNTLILHSNQIRHEFIIEPFLHNTSIIYIKDLLMHLRGKTNESRMD